MLRPASSLPALKLPAPKRMVLSLFLAAAVTACTRVPEIESKLTPDLRGAAYPTLLPLDDAVPTQVAPTVQGQELDAELKARAQRLKSRAAALKNREI
ncbi:hypothetical protein [Tritonibacter litoralis]|nr:hypothetical protein [Tritonibacter litoralis]